MLWNNAKSINIGPRSMDPKSVGAKGEDLPACVPGGCFGMAVGSHDFIDEFLYER